MADRTDFFFRQRVTEAELDLAFELLERADRNLAADIGVFGIVSGAEPTPHAPIADLTIDLTAPARAYDRAGRRIAYGTGQRVDCSVDLAGVPTEVLTPGNERWVGVFLKFDRQLSDPRTDGNGQLVYFRRDEGFEVVVRQGPDAAVGSATRLPMPEDELLVCEVRRPFGQTQILAEHIDVSRRQAFIFASGSSVAVQPGFWSYLDPVVPTVQSVLDQVDADLGGHLRGERLRHPATDVDFEAPADIQGDNVQTALTDLVSKLVSTVGNAGAGFVRNGSLPGLPNSLTAGSVRSQLASLLSWLNSHLAATGGAHVAVAISATPHEHISATNVQTQLQEIVADYKSNIVSQGVSLIGSASIAAGTVFGLTNGTLRSQLVALVNRLNQHVAGGDHDARYYRIGQQVGDAGTVGGLAADEFALAGHLHDSRYLRRTYQQSRIFNAGEEFQMTALSTRPDLVIVAYNEMEPSGLPSPTTWVMGQRSWQLRTWVTKQGSGSSKTYAVSVHNTSSVQLYVTVAAFARE